MLDYFECQEFIGILNLSCHNNGSIIKLIIQIFNLVNRHE